MIDITQAELKVLIPVQIGDSNLTSSTIPEADAPVWSSATNYSIGNRIMLKHRIYEAVRASTSADPKDPSNILNNSGNSPYWVDIGPTNRYAMFDEQVSTQSTATSTMTIVVRPLAVNSIYAVGMDADTFRAIVKDTAGGVVVYDETFTLEDSLPPDYYEWFFAPFRVQTDILIEGFEVYANPEITITLTKAAGATVKVGALVFGDLALLGTSQYGATASPKSFSYVDTDRYGNTRIVKGKSARDMEVTAELSLDEANAVVERLTQTMGVPCVWIATSIEQYRALRSYGLGNGKLSFDEFGTATLNLSVEGMI